MLLSIIIPIFRVEKYIEACLNSVLKQLPTDDVEVILVNDGTPDHSMDLARSLLKKYPHVLPHVVFIDQKNQGLSAARNTGIRHAKGYYLAFLDSDDLLKEHYITQVLQVLQQYPQIDLIQFRAERITDDGQVSGFLSELPYAGFHMLNEEILLTLFNRSAWFSWLRVYRKDLFTDLTFPVGRNYEDAYITPFLFLKATSIYFMSDVLVQYRINQKGITATKSQKNIDDLGHGALHYLNHIEQYPILAPTLIAISQSYINDSLHAEGYVKAMQRWNTLKQQITQKNIHTPLILNRGNRLFYRFGLGFLMLDRAIRKLGLKK